MLRAAILGQINSLFIFGEIVDTLWDYAAEKPWARRKEEPNIGVLNHIMNILVQPGYIMIDAMKEEDDAKADELFTEAGEQLVVGLTQLSGVGTDKLNRQGRYIADMLTGAETDARRIILMLLNYSEWVVYGEKEMKRRKKEEKDAKKVTPSTAPAIGEKQTTGFGKGETGFGKGESGFKKQKTGFKE